MSELARRLIADNKRTRATFLDLGNCDLTEIPAEVAELGWLESVSLGKHWPEWDGEELQWRQSQNTGGDNHGLIDLAPLASLAALQSLTVSGTQVADLAPLAGLGSLHFLI